MLTLAFFACAISAALADTTILVANPPVEVPRVAGYFDYMLVDAGRRRVLAAHTQSASIAFINADTSRLERQLYLGAEPHGLLLDSRDGIYLIGTSGAQHGIFMVDRTTLNIVGFMHAPGPVDALAFDSHRGIVYADEDDGDSIWVIPVANRRLIDTIHTPRDSDKGEYDAANDRVYQNFTSTNTTLIIDPVSHAAVAAISTLPARQPHGLAIDEARNRLYVAGTNGKLVEIDTKERNVLSTLAITSHVDQIAIDSARHRLYCASGDGYISVVAINGPRPALLANVHVPHGAHTLAVDPLTGAVWISYGTEDRDYVMKLHP